MSRELPEAGTYPGKLNGPMIVHFASTGSLCITIPVALDCEPAWSGKFVATLVTKDQVVQERTLSNLKSIFKAWNGQLETLKELIEKEDLSDTAFSAVCEHEEFTPERGDTRTVFKIKYLNSPDGGGVAMPESADWKTVIAKYGSKFRALSATSGTGTVATKADPKKETKQEEPRKELPLEDKKPAKPAAATSSSGPPGRKKASTATGGQPATATMEEAWDALKKSRPNDSDEDLGEKFWYPAIERLFHGKTNSDLTIQQWGSLKVHFES